MLTGGALLLCSYCCVLGSERDQEQSLCGGYSIVFITCSKAHGTSHAAWHRPCPESLQPTSSSTAREHSQAADDTEQSRTADRTVTDIHPSRAALQAGREQRTQRRAAAASVDAAAPSLSPAPRPPRRAGGRGLPPALLPAPAPIPTPGCPGPRHRAHRAPRGRPPRR